MIEILRFALRASRGDSKYNNDDGSDNDDNNNNNNNNNGGGGGGGGGGGHNNRVTLLRVSDLRDFTCFDYFLLFMVNKSDTTTTH